MERRAFLKKTAFLVPLSTVSLGSSSDVVEGGESNQNQLSGRGQVSAARPGDDLPDNSDGNFIEVQTPSLSIGVPEHVPNDAPVYNASEYELRDAPAFSEAIEQLSPDFEPGEYILFMHYEHWRELNRHIATHSNDVSLTAYSDFESHPDEERFFDFGDFVLNTQAGGYV